MSSKYRISPEEKEKLKQLALDISNKISPLGNEAINYFLNRCVYNDYSTHGHISTASLEIEKNDVLDEELSNKLNIKKEYLNYFHNFIQGYEPTGNFITPKDQIVSAALDKEMNKYLVEILEAKLDPRQVKLNHTINELTWYALKTQDYYSNDKENDKGTIALNYSKQLRKFSDEFFKISQNSKNEIALKKEYEEKFKAVLKPALDNKIISTHRGSKRLIGNIIISLTGIGLLFAGADLLYGLKKGGKSLLWDTKTESLLKQVKKSQEKILSSKRNKQ